MSTSKQRSIRRRSRLTVVNLEDRVTPATYTVTNALDDGSAGSLRAAITLANSSPDDDVIDFDPGFFSTHRDIDLASPLPAILYGRGGLTIAGPGAANLTVNAGSSFRVLESATPTLNLSGFTITGGLASYSDGGGLKASGIVTLDGMVVTGNSATGVSGGYGGTGGGVAMDVGGFLMVRNTTIAGNIAGSNGGGIGFAYGGSLVVENSTISGNRSISSGNPYGYYTNYIGYYGGGGIMFIGAASTTPPPGFTPGAIVIRNSTIANNSATGSGGGIGMRSFSGTLLLENSTVSGNSADASGLSFWGSYPYGGGGIKRISGSGEISIVNSVVAGNTNASIPDIGSGGLVNVNYSAIGNTTGFTPTGANNILDADPMLGPLQDNGGPTLTMAPTSGSPLIDAGSDDLAPTGSITDQRGLGFYRPFGVSVDIGSVEVQPPGRPFATGHLPTIVPGATIYQFTVTYVDPNGTNNGIDVSTLIDNNDAVHVSFPSGLDVPATYVSIDDPTNGTPRTVTYSFTPPGGSWNNVDDGDYSVRLRGNQVADIDGNFIPELPLGTILVAIKPFVVTNANDSGAGSLRAAILLANANSGDDLIEFDPVFFNTQQTIHLLNALPTISATGGALTIAGPGVNIVTVDAGGAFRVLDSEAPTLNLFGMTITGGHPTNDFNGIGAGLRASGTVTVDHMAFIANHSNTAGGAIAMNPDSSLTVRDSTIAGNSAFSSGGGIFFTWGGSFLLENSTISGNSTSYTGSFSGAYGGGGVYFAGVVSHGPDPDGYFLGTLVIRNCTIADNTTPGSGGGILAKDFYGSLMLENSTVSGNTSEAGTTGYYGPYYGGGGISVFRNRAFDPLILKNTIVSGNNNENGPDIFWNDQVNAFSCAIGSTKGFFLSLASSNNLIGQELNLGPLQDNGGPTQTMALGAGSAAIDAGSETLTPLATTSDQRGVGYFRSIGDAVDIGAFEAQSIGGPFATTSTPDIVPDTTAYQFTVTFSDPLGTNNGIDVSTLIGNNNAIHLTGPGGIDLPATYVSIDDASNGTPRTVTYSITPPGGSWNNYDTGVYAVRIRPNQVADLDGNFAPETFVGRFQVIISPFVVTNANDSGDGSLRAMIELANSLPQDDAIVFDPTFFATHRDIKLESVLPKFFGDAGGLTITGPGAANLTVDAGANFRVLDSEAPTLNLSGFTITGGFVNNDNGGGLRASGIVTLDGMVVTGNEATGQPDFYDGVGGGIGMVEDGFLTVRNSTISGNTAGVYGGGIGFYYGGSLVVENSTISGNQSTPTGNFRGYYGGGGISLYGRISNSPPPGFTPGVAVIRNSTIVNNSTTGSGGGILGYDIQGALLVQNSTITGNTSSATGTNYYGYPFGGGGLALVYGGDITVRNCVISGNGNANAPDILCQYDFVNSSFSLIGSKKGFSESNGAGNLAPGTNPMLGPLQDNGGPTLTMAPLSGSPLLNRGSNALVPSGVLTDQRGSGFDRIFGSAVDIGSVESQPPKVTIDQSAGQPDPTNGSAITFAVHFSSNVTGFDATDVSLAGSSVSGTLVVGVSGSGNNYTVTVTGMAGTGAVVANIPAAAAIDSFGQANLASTSTDNTVTFDDIAPTVAIEQAAGQADPATTGPVVFTVHFSEIVTGFDGSDISFAGSTVGGTIVAEVTGSGADYTVTVSGMAGQGTVVASIPAGAAADAAGNANSASSSSDNVVTFDSVPPSVTINQAADQNDPTNMPSVMFDVKFSEAVTGFTADDVSLIGSTAGGSLTASVSGSGDTYTIVVTGITSRGLVIASIPAGVASDLAGHLNLASTSTDNSVEYFNPGTVSFSAATYETNEEAGTITITVSRTGGTEGAVSIDFATTPDTAHSGTDYSTISGTFNWADGESGDRTFEIPILQDTLNEGKELINLTLTNAVGTPELGITSATVAIAPSDGQGPGVYFDQDGDKYSIKLAGKTGSLLYYRTDPDGDGKGPIELIELTGTLPDPLKPKASLLIAVTKAKTSADGGTVGLGAITGSGLASIVAPKANLNLEGINLNGYVKTLRIGNIDNGADVTTLATTNPKQKTSITAVSIGAGTQMNIGAGISSLVAKSFGAGSVTAPNIGTMVIKGDMAADITVSGVGVDPTKKALTLLRVTGVVSGIDITVGGNVGSVVVGAFRDSRLFAGYSGDDDGSGMFNVPATVTTFRSTGKLDGFQDSRVIATNFKTVSLTSIDSTNDGEKFGFYADQSLGAVSVIGPIRFKYNAAFPTPQGIGDFAVKIV
jgi:hypothetical protein